MIGRLLEKIVVAILDAFDPPKPPPPPPPLKPEERPDPKQVAAEMRAMASWLHAQADKLDPVVMPSFSMPPANLLPPKWNTVLDESGDSGGIIKRKGAGVELSKSPTYSACHETDITERDGEDERAEILERLDKGCCGGDCHCREEK